MKSLDIMLAQAPAAGAQPNPTGQMVLIGGYVVFFCLIFYFLSVRPQAKKKKELDAMLSAMKAGDKVVTSGGVVGTIVSVKERTVALRSADAKMEVLKSAVAEITERAGESAVAESQLSKS